MIYCTLYLCACVCAPVSVNQLQSVFGNHIDVYDGDVKMYSRTGKLKPNRVLHSFRNNNSVSFTHLQFVPNLY